MIWVQAVWGTDQALGQGREQCQTCIFNSKVIVEHRDDKSGWHCSYLLLLQDLSQGLSQGLSQDLSRIRRVAELSPAAAEEGGDAVGVQGMVLFNVCMKKPFPAELGAGAGAARATTARAEGLEVAGAPKVRGWL